MRVRPQTILSSSPRSTSAVSIVPWPLPRRSSLAPAPTLCSNVQVSRRLTCLVAQRAEPITDAVVLWDWMISLPREYRFVSLLHKARLQEVSPCHRYGERIGPQSK